MKKNKLFRVPDKIRNNKSISNVKDIKRVAVVGVGENAGASFITGLLAAAFSRRLPGKEEVAIIELGSPYFYEAYGIEKRFIQREFIQFYDILAYQESIKGFRNTEDNINWVLRCPLDHAEKDVSTADFFRLIHHVEGTLLFFDCSDVCENILWDILPEMDAVIAVIDPLPSKLIPGGPFIQRLRFVLPKTVFVINKMNKGVHKGELKRFLKGIDTYPIPLVSTPCMYTAEYSCILPYAIPDIKVEIEKPLKALSDALLAATEILII